MQTERAARSAWLPAAAVFGIAAMLRVGYVASVWPDPSVRYPILDSMAYHGRALEILTGEWLGDQIYYQDPLYPFLLAGLYAVFEPGSVAVLLFQALLDAGTALLVYATARHLFGDRVGLAAGLLAATYKVFFYYDALLLKVPLMLFLFAVALHLLVRAATSERVVLWGLAGAALGLAALTRGNSLLFAPLAVAWIAVFQSGSATKRLAAISALTLGVVLAILPVTLRNWVVGQDLVVLNSQGGQNFYIGNNRANDSGVYKAPPFLRAHPTHEEEDFKRVAEQETGREMKPSEVSRYWLGRGLDEIAADPAHFLRHSARKLLVFVNHYEVPDNQSYDFFRDQVAPILRWPLPTFGFVLPLGLVGMVLARRKRPALLLVAFFVAYSASVLAFFTISRMRLPVVLVLIVFAALALVTLADRLRAGEWRAALPALLFLLLAYPVVFLEVTPHDPTIRYFNLGQAHLARAAAHRGRAAELAAAGDGPAARAELVLLADQRAQGEALFREGLEVRPRNRRLREALESVHLARIVEADRLGLHEQALETARAFRDEFPRSADAWFHLARAHRKLGEYAAAVAEFERALELDPEHVRARRELGRLRMRGARGS